MIRILVCDDDQTVLSEIQSLLISWEKKHHIEFDTVCFSSADAVVAQSNNSYDIAFVDVEMPGISGLRLAETLKDVNPDVLIMIVTSFTSYLDSAMRIKVFRYLSKPIDRQRFARNLADAIKEYKMLSKTITVATKNSVHVVKTKDILFIQGMKGGSVIVTKQEKLQTTMRIADWLETINQPNCFVYSHTSFAVNLQNVIRFDKQDVILRKDPEHTVSAYMSGRRYSKFKQQFLNFAGDLL
ncbi:MAG: response regulator transcription factor [Clostridia bacterium]|nr:response regulator transcription factor [Clostridia bacterium]